MNDMLFVFLSLSVSGSILALILLALKPLVRNKLSQTWQYYIWLIVILRFLLPFTPQISVVGEMSRYVQNISNPPAVVEVDPGIGVNEEYTIPQAPEAPQTSQAPAPQNAETETPAQPAYWRDILNNIWLLWIGVALVRFVHKVASYQSFVRFVKVGAKKITDTHILDIYKTELVTAKVKRLLPLYENNQVVSPMLVSIVRPILVIPLLEASDDELRNILRHELTHYKRLDFLYKWIVQITLCLHWFNPLVYLINKQINKSCELSCDETVIRHLDEDSRIIYGDALMASLKAQGNYKNFVVSMTMSENGNIVKERLDAIVSYKKKSRFVFCMTILLTALLLCGFTLTGAYAAANSNNNAQGNMPISIINTEKEAVNVSDDYKQIVKTLDGMNIQNINIYADFCTLRLEPTSGNVFEAVFSYPKITAPNYENYFDLRMENSDNNTINISTDYDNVHGFDPIDGVDIMDLPSSVTLLIKIPQKQYNKVIMNISAIYGQTIDFGIDANSLEVNTDAADITFKTDKVFDNLYINHYTGSFELQLKELSKNMNIDVAMGEFILSLPSDPRNANLTIHNKEATAYDYGAEPIYNLPATWETSVTGNTVLFNRGNAQNIINVNNKRYGVFTVKINGIENNNQIAMPLSDNVPQEIYRTVTDISQSNENFNQTSLAKRLSNQNIESGDYFSWNRIDVVDSSEYAYEGMVFICKGSDNYTKVFNQALEQLYTAYPINEIAGYLDVISDKSLRNYGSEDFSAIKKIIVTDVSGVQHDAYVIVICGSEDFEKPYKEFSNTVMAKYYKYK